MSLSTWREIVLVVGLLLVVGGVWGFDWRLGLITLGGSLFVGAYNGMRNHAG